MDRLSQVFQGQACKQISRFAQITLYQIQSLVHAYGTKIKVMLIRTYWQGHAEVEGMGVRPLTQRSFGKPLNTSNVNE